MGLFDFMSDEAFRTSLEADYHELELCMQAGAWKAVHVLAGSIIETMLLDYLLATDYPKRSNLKLADMRLYEIINVCKNEHILTNKAADLSHVIREYRNLIHPEKVRRLGEAVDENGAIVAQALVRMVVEEVSTKRGEIYGYTAEQIVTKIVRDPSVFPILGHLLKSMNAFELRRLLLKVLPSRYFEIVGLENIPDDAVPSKNILAALERCFRLAFDLVSDEVKQEVAKAFVRILKEESAEVVATYEIAFFRGIDLEYYSPDDKQIVKHHFFSRIKNNITSSLLKAMEGIGLFLAPEDIDDFFVDPFIRTITDNDADVSYEKAKETFLTEFLFMNAETQNKVAKRLEDWVRTFKQRGWQGDINMTESLHESVIGYIFSRDTPDPFLPDYPDDQTPRFYTTVDIVPDVLSKDSTADNLDNW
jgi:hypothetical protein